MPDPNPDSPDLTPAPDPGPAPDPAPPLDPPPAAGGITYEQICAALAPKLGPELGRLGWDGTKVINVKG